MITPLKDAIAIHDALHAGKHEVQIGRELLTIRRYKGFIPHVEYKGIDWTVQNPRKSTIWAKYANDGHAITWGIKSGSWFLIINGILITDSRNKEEVNQALEVKFVHPIN